MSILERIVNYQDLKGMSYDHLDLLCKDLRRTIIQVVMDNGGHLGSPLGAVELTVALLRQFDPLKDRIVFDVGHQCYAYKILTDRRERFSTLRKWGGISGYPKREESSFDHFDVGHSSTSLSAALGYCKARDILNEDHEVVAVIGDGSLLNGVAFEALNYVSEASTKVIFILNDNTMCISPRVGGFATYLARLSSNIHYRRLKGLVREISLKMPRGEKIERFLEGFKEKVKGLLKPGNIFDEMGINYWGPFDGHNIKEMETVFTLAKKYDKPVLIHLVTKKGKGYKKAEKEPWIYHGIAPSYAKKCGRSWSSAIAEAVEKLAETDPAIVCLTAAMKEGNKLNHFQERFPDRFFDVGIAEEHMLTMAAGMAAGGLKPCVFIYSTFLQRAMDQLVHDIAMQNLPVILLIDRAGMIGEDGETHQGLLDISWGKSVPNLQIMAPRDLVDLNVMLPHAFKRKGPTLIRYPRGEACEKLFRKGLNPGRFDERLKILQSGSDWVLIALGNTVSLALQVARMSNARELPPPTVVDLRMIKPMDWISLRKILTSHSLAVTMEEGYINGGVGEAIASYANQEGITCTVKKLGVPDFFLPQGTVEQQWQHCGITVDQVVNVFLEHQKGKT